ncbi:hypothetical protein SLS60_011819 [Paraconiothyrium brasiliense]|uniref:C2H2-type domain-containing protein n=1 Tax=Paraconiothyrium brasiliense TaxID=300254 RepID=A0ABR3QI47_9PLEO
MPADIWKHEDIQAVILSLVWTCLLMTNPALRPLNFMVVFPDQTALFEQLKYTTLTFATGLLDVLRSPEAPGIAYFKSLALHLDPIWAIYLLVLEKPGHRPRIYVGSGTNKANGFPIRWATYDKLFRLGINDGLVPLYVEKAFQEGYKMTHSCVLVWAPIPFASERLTLRGLFILFENIFHHLFWPMISKTKDWDMPHLCPWPIESFEYDGCNTHFPIVEGLSVDPSMLKLSRDEINALDVEKRKAHNRLFIARKGEGVHAAQSMATRKQALEEQRYKCVPCVMTFPNLAKLRTHEAGGPHQQKVSGAPKVLKGRGGSQLATIRKTF